ncbi:MAG: hypothetical protein J6R22_03545 [Alphaproteobacteria bacterium]|nr:hypothetical protein [Alphaproteobacteria bacterium]
MIKKLKSVQSVSRGMIGFGGNGYVPSAFLARLAQELEQKKENCTILAVTNNLQNEH